LSKHVIYKDESIIDSFEKLFKIYIFHVKTKSTEGMKDAKNETFFINKDEIKIDETDVFNCLNFTDYNDNDTRENFK
jgi:hypothetical protein